MDFKWIKKTTSDKEEKEQFDKLYHLLVQLSHKGDTLQGDTSQADKVEPVPPLFPVVDKDEFTTLKMDILANFNLSGESIAPLETCRGCDRSFYSTFGLEKHWSASPACKRFITECSDTDILGTLPFLSFLEKGMATLLQSDATGTHCRFCQRDLPSRKAQEKHYGQSIPCNRLAHHTFRQWFLSSDSLSSDK